MPQNSQTDHAPSSLLTYPKPSEPFYLFHKASWQYLVDSGDKIDDDYLAVITSKPTLLNMEWVYYPSPTVFGFGFFQQVATGRFMQKYTKGDSDLIKMVSVQDISVLNDTHLFAFFSDSAIIKHRSGQFVHPQGDTSYPQTG